MENNAKMDNNVKIGECLNGRIMLKWENNVKMGE